jgi:hypothetical protein
MDGPALEPCIGIFDQQVATLIMTGAGDVEYAAPRVMLIFKES